MRLSLLSSLLCALLPWTTGSELQAQPPIGRSPDLYENITKVVKATEEEQKTGLLATIWLKGSNVAVHVTKETQLPISKGKLQEKGTVADLKVGERVSVWYTGKVTKTDPPQAKAYMVMIFQPGKPGPVP